MIAINTSSGVPLYRQIVDQVKVLVATGKLKLGDRLPSVRQLSEQLVINPTTVQRAYLDLETAGVIESRHGQGSFIAAGPAGLSKVARERQFAEHLRNALAEAFRLQFDVRDVRRVFDAELQRVFGSRREKARHG